MNKCLSIFSKYSPIIALSLNFIGALFLICSSSILPGGFTNTDANGYPLDALYLLYPTMFRTGVGFIIVGFLVQALNELLKFNPIMNILAKISLKNNLENRENGRKCGKD